MSVSVDVSTGDDDAGHRYFGTVTEVMECQGDKHGVTLLVQDAEPNFKADSVLEDAARLDWLALAGPTSICVVVDRRHDGEVEVATDDVTGYGKTLREAIDAARKQGANHD